MAQEDTKRVTATSLADEFRAFYLLIIELKRKVSYRSVSAAEGSEVWQRLLASLERSGISAARAGGIQAATHEELRYIMAAMADEVFLNLDWGGRESWKLNLLEEKLFESHIAGERFFERLDKLLAERDPSYQDLAGAYLLALSLGFEGKYRGTDDQGRLAEYRRRLFSLLEGREPGIELSGESMYPDALANTLREEQMRRLPSEAAWKVGLVLGLVLFFVGSFFSWQDVTDPLEKASMTLIEGSPGAQAASGGATEATPQ